MSRSFDWSTITLTDVRRLLNEETDINVQRSLSKLEDALALGDDVLALEAIGELLDFQRVSR